MRDQFMGFDKTSFHSLRTCEAMDAQQPFQEHSSALFGCHDPNLNFHLGSQNSSLCLDADCTTEVPEIPDTCFNYISDLLREEGRDDALGATLHHYMTVQNSCKSLSGSVDGLNAHSFDLLPSSVCQNAPCLDDYSNLYRESAPSRVFESSWIQNTSHLDPTSEQFRPPIDSAFQFTAGVLLASGMSTRDGPNHSQLNELGAQIPSSSYVGVPSFTNPTLEGASRAEDGKWVGSESVYCVAKDRNYTACCPSGICEITDDIEPIINLADKPRGRKHQQEDDNGHKSTKKPSFSNEVFDEIEQYGDILLCPEGRSRPAPLCNNNNSRTFREKSQKDSKKRGNNNKGHIIDLRSLLVNCAHYISRVDIDAAKEILSQIRQHSTPYGNSIQRVAHYLANALEARVVGNGLELSLDGYSTSAFDILKANRVYVAYVPFKIMSYYVTNKTIAKLAESADSLHIIDFGIFYGLQWPCIIQNLSKRPNGPPRLRITGIDFPERGFRPGKMIEETGRCLAKYCARFGVPFEYHSISKEWETIKLDDLKIDRNEPLIVNCLYRSHNLFDESVDENSPRDAFLNLTREINPDIFLHGIVNSTFSAPFFLTRFREALFHYTALFELFEATMNRDDQERFLLESKMYGNQALNVIACEGVDRVARPETYKQWQSRTLRAGFQQIPFDPELLKRANAMVKKSFREEFVFDEHCQWVVQGWKGRVLYAVSCWKCMQ